MGYSIIFSNNKFFVENQFKLQTSKIAPTCNGILLRRFTRFLVYHILFIGTLTTIQAAENIPLVYLLQ